MFVRYKTDRRGRAVPVARIYNPKEHPIRNSMIDRDALWAIRKLQAAGCEAYIVGGAIRDIILDRRPKDFDISTSASPRQVQRLFWNSRIIGRRFKIVHLFFGEKIIEVTTFRSDEENFEEGNNNVYGNIEQDAKRRDFSINSLYYNPQNGQLLDFNNAYPDFKRGVIRSLIPLSYSFSEDPVRMIRAIKYMCTTGFRLKWNVKHAIRRNAPRIEDCSPSRLTEEVLKILCSGSAEAIFENLYSYNILQHLLPCYAVYSAFPSQSASLKLLDERVKGEVADGRKISKAEALYYLIKPALIIPNADDTPCEEAFRDVFRQAKVLLTPITPPNYDIEKAVTLVLESAGIITAKNKKAQKKKPASRRPSQRLKVDAERARRKPKKKKVVVENRAEVKESESSLALSHDE